MLKSVTKAHLLVKKHHVPLAFELLTPYLLVVFYSFDRSTIVNQSLTCLIKTCEICLNILASKQKPISRFPLILLGLVSWLPTFFLFERSFHTLYSDLQIHPINVLTLHSASDSFTQAQWPWPCCPCRRHCCCRRSPSPLFCQVWSYWCRPQESEERRRRQRQLASFDQ